MEREEKIILEKMRVLIALSCQFDKRPEEHFRNFHKSILKFSFDAVDVKVNYKTKEIYISNPKPLTTDPVRLYDMKEAVADTFSYTDLEETVAGCLKSGHLPVYFYKKILKEYSDDLSGNPDFSMRKKSF